MTSRIRSTIAMSLPASNSTRPSCEDESDLSSEVKAASTQVTILPPILTHERGQRRQASLFEIDDKDVI